MNSSKNHYPYAHLNIDRREIRLLKLLPGRNEEPIRCTLERCSLDDGPEYIALSYMWGEEDGDCITLDDNNRFQVTRNLFHALHSLRLHDTAVTLWVDAICINQSDIAERGNQVRLMKDIYSRAQEVWAWVDIEIPVRDPILHLLEKLSERAEHGLGDDVSAWDTMVELFKNPYWDRLWIQQELVCSRKFSVYCRKTRLDGEAIMEVQRQLVRQRGEASHPVMRQA